MPEPIPWRLARAQGPVLASFARLALSGLGRGSTPPLPGPLIERRFAPRAPEHLEAYARHVGAPPPRGQVPPHLFPHWCFALTGRLVGPLPYRMLSAVNAGCDVRVRGPLPADEPITVRGWLEAVDDNEKRVLVTQRFVSSTPSAPEALEADVTLLLPRRRPRGAGTTERREPERVPDVAEVVGRFAADARAGLDFAKLTGDFNPLHWSAGYARALGFRRTILHGFATAARSWAALERHRGRPLERFACRFPRPVLLPATLEVYARGEAVWVGEAPGDEARLVGRFG